MNVSSEQLEALSRGETVPVFVETKECLLIRKETFEEMQKLLAQFEELKKQNVEEIDPSFFEFDEV